jgi:transcriptional regulator with XRE-family HTH domain
MSNVLKVSLQTTIYSLAERGWSQRRIAKELGVNRETVGRYLRLSKPAISITAIQVLRDLGYLNVGSLKGGLQGWLEAGGLVESSGGRNSGSSRQTRPIRARSDW